MVQGCAQFPPQSPWSARHNAQQRASRRFLILSLDPKSIPDIPAPAGSLVSQGERDPENPPKPCDARAQHHAAPPPGGADITQKLYSKLNEVWLT